MESRVTLREENVVAYYCKSIVYICLYDTFVLDGKKV
jgi:hypothetical protein